MARKMAVSKKVAALIRRVQKRILAEPRRFDMSSWGHRYDKEHLATMGRLAPPCGTTLCIWTGE